MKEFSQSLIILLPLLEKSDAINDKEQIIIFSRVVGVNWTISEKNREKISQTFGLTYLVATFICARKIILLNPQNY